MMLDTDDIRFARATVADCKLFVEDSREKYMRASELHSEAEKKATVLRDRLVDCAEHHNRRLRELQEAEQRLARLLAR